MITLRDYREYMEHRQAIISLNRSNRMRRAAPLPLPVPPPIERPQVRVAYTTSGDYVGRLSDDQAAPSECVIRLEDQMW